MAHHELVHAALTSPRIDGTHFFTPEEPLSDTPFQLLRRSFPSKDIKVAPLVSLVSMAPLYSYVFPVAMEHLPLLATTRLSLSSGHFPVSGIVHSISSHASSSLYLNIMLQSELYDRLVVTSRAGYCAISRIFDGYEEFLFSKLGPHRVSRPKIATIPLGVDVKLFGTLPKEAFRAQLGITSDQVVVLYLGRLTQEYKADLEPLLIAFQSAHKRHPTSVLLLAGHQGSSGYVDVLRRQVQELGIERAVRFCTNFPFDQKYTLYSCADIFVSPSDNIQETFGITLLEAAASSLPIIASDWSGYKDLVIDGKTGILVPTRWDPTFAAFANIGATLRNQKRTSYLLAQHTVVDPASMRNALLLLMERPDLRESMGRKGRARVISEFDWSVIMSRFIDLWEEQRDELNASDTPHRRINLTLNEIYGHYATSTMRSTDSFKIAVERPITSSNIPEYEPYTSLTALQRDRSYTRTELLNAKESLPEDVLSWLLKKGYLVE